MNEVLYVKKTILQNKPCFLAGNTLNRIPWSNYLIYEIPWSGNNEVARLHDIQGSANGIGSILLISFALETIRARCNLITGEFSPRGVREQVLSWYEKRGFDLNDSEISGTPSKILESTRNRINKFGIKVVNI